MDRHPNVEQIDSKKRGLGHIAAAELEWKLKSKDDFYEYLDKRRKCNFRPNLLFSSSLVLSAAEELSQQGLSEVSVR